MRPCPGHPRTGVPTTFFKFGAPTAWLNSRCPGEKPQGAYAPPARVPKSRWSGGTVSTRPDCAAMCTLVRSFDHQALRISVRQIGPVPHAPAVFPQCQRSSPPPAVFSRPSVVFPTVIKQEDMYRDPQPGGGTGGTRTRGLLNPNQARCHLRYCSICAADAPSGQEGGRIATGTSPMVLRPPGRDPDVRGWNLAEGKRTDHPYLDG